MSQPKSQSGSSPAPPLADVPTAGSIRSANSHATSTLKSSTCALSAAVLHEVASSAGFRRRRGGAALAENLPRSTASSSPANTTSSRPGSERHRLRGKKKMEQEPAVFVCYCSVAARRRRALRCMRELQMRRSVAVHSLAISSRHAGWQELEDLEHLHQAAASSTISLWARSQQRVPPCGASEAKAPDFSNPPMDFQGGRKPPLFVPDSRFPAALPFSRTARWSSGSTSLAGQSGFRGLGCRREAMTLSMRRRQVNDSKRQPCASTHSPVVGRRCRCDRR